MSRRKQGLILGACLVAAAVVTIVVLAPGGSSGSPAQAGQPPATTAVVKTTLIQTTQVSGTLSYGVPQGLKAPPGKGTITWLPAEGATVAFGSPAYKVNNLPVNLIKGTVPLYKTLKQGVSGPDVLELEQYLVGAGYLLVEPDTKFDSATTAAVHDWQGATGQPGSGKVEPGQLIVQPAPLRVALNEAEVGDPLDPGAAVPLYTYNTTQPKVIVGLDVAKQHLVKVGLAATVILPTGKELAGKVTVVATVATQPPADSSDPPNIPVVVSLNDPSAVNGLDSAPVDVELVATQKKDVLAVPVNALVALAEGGYGVQVVDGSNVNFVAVELGMFAGGKVEISGAGIVAGTVVGVPS